MGRIGISLLLWLLSQTDSHAVTQSTLTMDVEMMPVTQVFAQLAEFQQMNLIIAPGVTGNLSLRFQNIDWSQAVALVSEMAGVSSRISGNVLRVSPVKPVEQTLGMAEEPLQSQRFILRNTLYSEIQPLLAAAGILSPRGTVSGSTRANILMVRDTPRALDALQEWLNVADIPIPQVEITAHIISISEESLRELGAEWGFAAEPAARGVTANSLGIPLGVDPAYFTAGLTLSRINGRILSLELSALEQENQVEIIASPRLIASQGSVASIKQGTEIPYLVMQGDSDNATVEFKDAVLGMEITPEVLGAEEIRLMIRLSQNMPGKVLQQGSNMPLSIDKQEIATRVTLKEGQTLALGGIFQQNQNSQQNKVPVLGDIPLLGSLFRRDSRQQSKRELVIFITPRLIIP